MSKNFETKLLVVPDFKRYTSNIVSYFVFLGKELFKQNILYYINNVLLIILYFMRIN